MNVSLNYTQQNGHLSFVPEDYGKPSPAPLPKKQKGTCIYMYMYVDPVYTYIHTCMYIPYVQVGGVKEA